RVTSTDSAFGHRFEIMMTLGKIVVVNAVGDADYIQTVDAYNDGQWHHLVAVRNSDTAGDMKLFIDGEQPAVDTIFDGWSTNSRCRIGAQGTNTNAWIGVMDEYAHFTVALSDEQVEGLFEAAISGAAVDVSPTIIEVTEGGDPNSYQVVLKSQPTAEVEITAVPDDGEINIGNGAGNAIILTFTNSNWETPQTVIVTAVDDDEYEEDDPHTTLITHSAQSDDTDYLNIDISSVIVDVRDNELVCGDWGYLQMDYNMDCNVDLLDFAIFARHWLEMVE
ncbi:MAG: hypothetical protein JXA04_12365, partial [Gammaproteobacteria bacterium]|nr:hypothetical protein [Gammaproteobacteria bacterium]